MNVFHAIAAFAMFVGTISATAADFEIEFIADGQTVAQIELKLEEDAAVATVAGESERFNLKEMSWFDAGANKWITLSECERWMEESKARTLRGLNSAPPQIRKFLEWSLEPSFKVEKSNESLRLISGQVDYIIEGEAATTHTEAYFRYAILNAYKKALAERKLPPFSELKAIEEMKALGSIPRRMTIKMPAIPSSPTITVQITEKENQG